MQLTISSKGTFGQGRQVLLGGKEGTGEGLLASAAGQEEETVVRWS
jgi:hypothetical protein